MPKFDDSNITIIRPAPNSVGTMHGAAESSSGDGAGAGEYKKQKMVMPNTNENPLAKAMAEAAAAKYEKDKDKIQKACAEIDGGEVETKSKETEDIKKAGCCVIL